MTTKPHVRALLVTSFSTVLAVAALSAGANPSVARTAETSVTAHWQSMGPDTSGGHLAFTPAAPSRLYVLPDAGNSVYRSDDRGATWGAPGWLGSHDFSGRRLAADPRDADVVWVAATAPGTGLGSVLRSEDGAKTFHTVLSSPTDITDVVVSPTGGRLFAAGTAGVWESLDHGTHWTLLPGSPGDAQRLALSGDRLFIGTTTSLYVIADALTHPHKARELSLPSGVYVQHLSARDGVVVADQSPDGNAVISTDNGSTWRTLSGPWGTDWVAFSALTANGEIQVETLQPAIDATTARKNLWISSDRGRTWTRRPKAVTALDLYEDLGSFPDRPNEQVVTGPAGTFSTYDSVRYRRIGVPAAEVDALVVADHALVAGTAVDSYSSRAALTESLPAGYQNWGWSGRSPATLGNSIGALAVAPGRGLIRARMALCPDSCIALERSSNGGATWQPLNSVFVNGATRSVAVDPRDPSRLYVGVYGLSSGLFTSTDGGRTLQRSSIPGLQGVRSVAIDPRAGGSLWIGDASGLYLSKDSGASAVQMLSGDVERVAVDPRDPDHIVVAGQNTLKVSHDGGVSFSDAVGQPAAHYDDVAFAPDGTVFAASADALDAPGKGVVRSVDGGARFTDIASGLPDRDVRSILVSPDGEYLFAGTGGSGVYRIALNLLGR
ncbi:WD40/YVTN/BNR-like repeat-containing protein [Streptomyces sp. AF1A]|uniref:WD40/YVTN/BNR-like repeat-containing protein n=1 Tax=Streptomyces sp. AF1A TaxID=3394350 RepID=UPI0039BC7752